MPRGHRGPMSQARGREARDAGPGGGRGGPYSSTLRAAPVSEGRARSCLLPPLVGGPLAAAMGRKESRRPCSPRSPGGARWAGDRDSSPPPRKTKDTVGLGREKFSSRLQRNPSATSRPKYLRGGWGAGCGFEAGFPERSRKTAAQSESRRRPRPAGTPPALPPPVSRPAS